jgi:hypothetical protein
MPTTIKYVANKINDTYIIFSTRPKVKVVEKINVDKYFISIFMNKDKHAYRKK